MAAHTNWAPPTIARTPELRKLMNNRLEVLLRILIQTCILLNKVVHCPHLLE